jgi:hypothetical protein
MRNGGGGMGAEDGRRRTEVGGINLQNNFLV